MSDKNNRSEDDPPFLSAAEENETQVGECRGQIREEEAGVCMEVVDTRYRPLAKAKVRTVSDTRTLIGERVVDYAVGDQHVLSEPISAGSGEGGSIMTGGARFLASSEGDDERDSSPEFMSTERAKTLGRQDEASPPNDTESGDRVVQEVQEADFEEEFANERELVHGVLTIDEDKGAEITDYSSSIIPLEKGQRVLDTMPPPSERQPAKQEVTLDEIPLSQMSELLREDTLEAQLRLDQLHEKLRVAAHLRWNILHLQKNHNLSENGPHRVSKFAKDVIGWFPLDSESLLMDFGCGFGNDAVHFSENSEAHIIGIDNSEDAITKAQKYARTHARTHVLKGRLDFVEANFIDVLETAEGSNVNLVFANSVFHYKGNLYLREILLPMTAEILRPSKFGPEPGWLCLALKTANSDSAKKPWQHKLLPGHPAGPTFDKKDLTFRNYWKDMDAVLAEVKPSYKIIHAETVIVSDYESNGDDEEFVQIIARPK